MRFLHTSDWHLGRALHGVDLAAAQEAALAAVVDIARERAVDAVLVSGDVFDRPVPPVESVRLLERTLAALDAAGIHVVIVSGNHDSPARLGYGGGLFRPHLHVRTSVHDVGSPVVLHDPHGPVLVYPIPFLVPDVAAPVLAADSAPVARSHEAVMAAAMRRVHADRETRGPHRAVVVAHAFVVGGHPSDSERDLQVGGVATVPSGVFGDVDLVALGHLHGPQQPASCGTRALLRYAGSPLRYSFSEAAQEKSVSILDLGPDGHVDVELVPVAQPRPMAVLAGGLDELLGPAHDSVADHWVAVTVTDVRRPDAMVDRLRARFPHLLRCTHQPAERTADPDPASVGPARDPLEVMADFVRHVTGGPPSDDELVVLRSAYEAVLLEEASA